MAYLDPHDHAGSIKQDLSANKDDINAEHGITRDWIVDSYSPFVISANPL